MTELAVNNRARAAHESVERHDVEAVNAAARRGLYKAREPIYPKAVNGKFRTLKWTLLIVTLGVYYVLPWLRWPRGPGEPDQAVMVDFPGRRFYFFFIEIWPDELYFLTGLLILAALALFFATALFGRVWCGYACPQTVWTDLFIAVERLVEGDRNKRIHFARAPWTASKAGKKVVKHALWLLIAMGTGGAWVFYFHDAPAILPKIFNGAAPASAYLFIGILTFTTYVLAGSMREQVCTYMCPWPRIQAALVDADTLQVTYKRDRGELRGPHKKGEPWEGRGDCVSCRACVAACPMGIDIRDGDQLECINCALCIDACDEIMKKVGRPTGLIGYDTNINLSRRAAGERPVFRIIRPRTILYAVLLAAVGGLMTWGLSTRATMEINVLRDRTPPFVKLSDGSVRNAYTVKLVNKDDGPRLFRVTFDGPEGMMVSAVGETVEGASADVVVDGDTVRAVRMFATLDPGPATRSSEPVRIIARDIVSGETAENPTVFLLGER
ncbi:MAG: cytochrome c oxidase accessory protein CcoG [Parvularculaceae bacterium]